VLRGDAWAAPASDQLLDTKNFALHTYASAVAATVAEAALTLRCGRLETDRLP